MKKDKNDGLGEDNGSRAGDLAQGKLMSDLLKMAGQGEKEKDDAKGENGFAFKRLPSARPENRNFFRHFFKNIWNGISCRNV